MSAYTTPEADQALAGLAIPPDVVATMTSRQLEAEGTWDVFDPDRSPARPCAELPDVPDGLEQHQLDSWLWELRQVGVSKVVGRQLAGIEEVLIDGGGTSQRHIYVAVTADVPWGQLSPQARQEALQARVTTWQRERDQQAQRAAQARTAALDASRCDTCPSLAGSSYFSFAGRDGQLCVACQVRVVQLFGEAQATPVRDEALTAWLAGS